MGLWRQPPLSPVDYVCICVCLCVWIGETHQFFGLYWNSWCGTRVCSESLQGILQHTGADIQNVPHHVCHLSLKWWKQWSHWVPETERLQPAHLPGRVTGDWMWAAKKGSKDENPNPDILWNDLFFCGTTIKRPRCANFEVLHLKAAFT